MVARDAEEAMKKLESNCSLTLPTVPQLQFESPKLGTKVGNEGTRKSLTLDVVRGNLAERGINTAPFFATRLFSVTSLVIPAFSVV
jgi:hypothetical protein